MTKELEALDRLYHGKKAFLPKPKSVEADHQIIKSALEENAKLKEELEYLQVFTKENIKALEAHYQAIAAIKESEDK